MMYVHDDHEVDQDDDDVDVEDDGCMRMIILLEERNYFFVVIFKYIAILLLILKLRRIKKRHDVCCVYMHACWFCWEMTRTVIVCICTLPANRTDLLDVYVCMLYSRSRNGYCARLETRVKKENAKNKIKLYYIRCIIIVVQHIHLFILKRWEMRGKSLWKWWWWSSSWRWQMMKQRWFSRRCRDRFRRRRRLRRHREKRLLKIVKNSCVIVNLYTRARSLILIELWLWLVRLWALLLLPNSAREDVWAIFPRTNTQKREESGKTEKTAVFLSWCVVMTFIKMIYKYLLQDILEYEFNAIDIFFYLNIFLISLVRHHFLYTFLFLFNVIFSFSYTILYIYLR